MRSSAELRFPAATRCRIFADPARENRSASAVVGSLGATGETLIVVRPAQPSPVTEPSVNRPSSMWVSTISPEGRIQHMTRHRHGHGSLLRGDDIALPHVGYWIVEHRNASTFAISGHVRGDAKVLEALNKVGQQLLLILDNGTRLPILLTEQRTDGLTWEFTSTEASPIDFVTRPPRAE